LAAYRAEDRDAVNRVVAKVCKAVEVFARSRRLTTPPGSGPRCPRAKDSAVLFVRLGCVHCGPLHGGRPWSATFDWRGVYGHG